MAGSRLLSSPRRGSPDCCPVGSLSARMGACGLFWALVGPALGPFLGLP